GVGLDRRLREPHSGLLGRAGRLARVRNAEREKPISCTRFAFLRQGLMSGPDAAPAPGSAAPISLPRTPAERAEAGGGGGEMIPLAKPVLGEAEEQAVVGVLRSGRLSLGPRIEEFERAFAAHLGAPLASAVSSGTAALHLALRAAGVGEGEGGLTSPVSVGGSGDVILYERARPVFADIDPVTLNLDPEAAASAVRERTRALLPVHVFGYPAEIPAFERIAARHDLAIVEDACEALGAEHGDGTLVG